ncbi:RidA family protein [Micromonospora chokoriensis]
MPRHSTNPARLIDSRPYGFSQVVSSPPGTTVHVAGQVPWDSDGNLVATGREAQLRAVLGHVAIAVEAAGGTAQDIQMLRIYMPNLRAEETEVIARVLVDVYGDEDPPASTWIGVEALAQPEFEVEVDAVAIIV